MGKLIRRDNSRGFTLVEVIIVIVLIGVLATVAVRRLSSSVETARYEQTKRELDELAHAIAGNPELRAGGARSDFGYVGDVGALPPTLDALVLNPGGYSTWDGPYVTGDFDTDGFKKDAWNTVYLYTDTLIRSTGAGFDIDKVFAPSSAALLSNTVAGTIVDASGDVPGSVYGDSVIVCLTFPDGVGGVTTAYGNPGSNGNFLFTGVPVGNHSLRVVYSPDADTASYGISVGPGSTVKISLVFPADLW